MNMRDEFGNLYEKRAKWVTLPNGNEVEVESYIVVSENKKEEVEDDNEQESSDS